jgi:phospholipase/carboxylesterase
MVDWTKNKILQGLRDVSPLVNEYVTQALNDRQLTYQDLALVGFSQGAMLALYQAYYVLPLCAGVIAYSGAFLEDMNLEPKSLPRSLLIHGDADPIIPVEGTLMAGEIIKKIGGNPTVVIREGLPHAIDAQGLILGQEFLQNVFGYEKMQATNNTG